MHSRIIIQRTRNNLEHFKDGICKRISKKRIEKNIFFFLFWSKRKEEEEEEATKKEN